MKKLILLLFIPLVFACSSDDSSSSNSENNSSESFLEKYDGVIWKDDDDDINDDQGLWTVFSIDGFLQVSYGYVDSGICDLSYVPWNIVGDYGDFNKVEVMDNNSVDELILEVTETNSETYLVYITAINNGNNLLMTTDSDHEDTYYTRDTTSNICN